MARVQSWSEDVARNLASAPPAMLGGRVSVLGVAITDAMQADALRLFERLMLAEDRRTRVVFFANAHTLNLAWEDRSYRTVLNSADYVFGDGTGVRWAARLRGVRLRDNVNGTDAVPTLLGQPLPGGGRYFLLGARPDAITAAAAQAQQLFPDWQLVGHHHGYLEPALTSQVIEQINASRPHLLLVGMGNPLQERWLMAARAQLKVPLCMGTGGLFEYWAGNLDRAPAWLRRHGLEWLHILRRQPHKLRRYGLGNPMFLSRMLRERLQLP